MTVSFDREVSMTILAGAVLAFMLIGAETQTQQWSSPTTTQRWSEAPAPRSSAGQRQAAAGPPQAPAPYSGRVDPSWMDNPRLVDQASAPPQAMTGQWALWTPGGVWYSQDGQRILRHHASGAALNTLTIYRDGAYRWAGQEGRLVEIQPWFAQPGERYFEVKLDSQNRYMLRYDPANDRINLFFWGVGGHAARGDRR